MEEFNKRFLPVVMPCWQSLLLLERLFWFLLEIIILQNELFQPQFPSLCVVHQENNALTGLQAFEMLAVAQSWGEQTGGFPMFLPCTETQASVLTQRLHYLFFLLWNFSLLTLPCGKSQHSQAFKKKKISHLEMNNRRAREHDGQGSKVTQL